MNEFLKQSIARVTERIETRRMTGILRKSPGALGEPTGFLPAVEKQAPAVSWGEIHEQIEREVVRHRGNLEAVDPVEMQRRIQQWIDRETLRRKIESEP